LAIGLFVATITFLFTTPGVGEATAGGFPVLSATGKQDVVGQLADRSQAPSCVHHSEVTVLPVASGPDECRSLRR